MNNFSGLIEDPRTIEEKAKDFKVGSDNEIKAKKRTKEWTQYLTIGEAQSVQGKWDSMSCVSFAIGEDLEPQINFDFNSLREDTKKFLIDNGYIQDGKVRFSKRALAIMSGTTPSGNYFWKVFETARLQGLIPDSDLPFGGNSQSEYLGATITPAMLAKGKKFLEYFKIQYQIVQGFDNNVGFNPSEIANIDSILSSAPVVIGVPIPCSHAIITHKVRENDYDAQDHYVPYFRTNNAITVPVQLAYQGYIEEIPKSIFHFQFNRNLTKNNSYDSDVENLQKILVEENCMTESEIGQWWGFFGNKTLNGVIKFQEKYSNEILKPVGLTKGTGYVGNSTRAFLNNKYK